MSNGTAFFPPGRTDLVLFPLEHISHQELLEKMLRDRDEVAFLIAVLSCFVWRSLKHIQNSTLPWHWWEELTNFSRGRVCKPGELTHRKFGKTSPQFSRQSDPKVFVLDQEQARTMADHFASSVVSTRKTPRHLVGFRDQRNWGRFEPGRNAKWNTKFPEFPNFQKKGQPREVNRNFRSEFPENFCSIRFWTGRISGNFGRMERALRHTTAGC